MMPSKPLMDYGLPCRTEHLWDRHHDYVTLPTGEECKVYVMTYGNKYWPPRYGVTHGDGTFQSSEPMTEAQTIFYLKYVRSGLWNPKTGFKDSVSQKAE